MQTSPQDLSKCDIPVFAHCTYVLFAVSLQMTAKRSKPMQGKQERQKEKSGVDDDEESSRGVQSDGPLHSVVVEERPVGTSEVAREEKDRCARLYCVCTYVHQACM